jgi:hypothetical protein
MGETEAGMTKEELIAALEAATGPSYALDEAVAVWHYNDLGADGRKVIAVAQPRCYTASIDAAMTLVPDGSYWNILTEGDGDGFLAAVVTRQGADAGEPLSWMKAPTPAIALCIAALRTRA